MTAKDFRRIALGMEGAIESSHMDHPDFRVGNRIFATLTHDEQMGMVALPPGKVQQEFIRAHPSAFSMVNGAWGLQGATRVHLESAEENAVGEAVTVAWRHAAAKGPTRGTKVAPSTRTLKEMLAPYPRDVQSLANDSALLAGGWIERAGLRRLLDEHDSGVRDHGDRLFALLVLNQWLETA